MKIISWNVNGLKSVINQGFYKTISQLNADFICLQETKISEQLELKLENYYQYFNLCRKSGYAGVGILAKEKPLKVIMGMEIEDTYGEIYQTDNESRVITLEYNDFYIVSTYIPHSQTYERKLYRQTFDDNFIKYIEKLNETKDIIICGDFNIHKSKIDIANFKKHKFINVFEDEELGNFNRLLDIGFIDTYRFMHPQMRDFTFWTNSESSRKNAGWRLDYILVSNFLRSVIREANILQNIGGSDHCPIELVLKM